MNRKPSKQDALREVVFSVAVRFVGLQDAEKITAEIIRELRKDKLLSRLLDH